MVLRCISILRLLVRSEFTPSQDNQLFPCPKGRHDAFITNGLDTESRLETQLNIRLRASVTSELTLIGLDLMGIICGVKINIKIIFFSELIQFSVAMFL